MINPFDLSGQNDDKEKNKSVVHLNITMDDWKCMHPFPNRNYRSDPYYLGIAKKIVGILESYNFSKDFSGDYIRHVALCLAAYFEDVVSELGLFRCFVKRYREIFHREFPWYEVEEEYYEDEVNLVDVRFVLWLSMFEMTENAIPNPLNPTAEQIASDIYNLMLDEFEIAPVNNILVQQFYDKQILADPGKLKALFIWMSSNCYLLPIMLDCKRLLEQDFEILHEVFEPVKSNPIQADYLDMSYAAFAQRRGPLALFPKEWYVLMRQEKGLTEGNEDILKMEISPLYPYAIIKNNAKTFIVRSCRGIEYEVDKMSFADMNYSKLRVGDILITMLFSYKGLWNICGFSTLNPLHNMDKALDILDSIDSDLKNANGEKVDLLSKVDQKVPGNSPYGPTFDPYKCERLIERNDGDRMFHFEDIHQTDKWVEKNIAPREIRPPERPKETLPIAIYINDEYQLLITKCGEMIHDPRNKYYSSEYDDDLLASICDPEQISDPIVEYMVVHNYTDNLRLNTYFNEGKGLKLMQENIRFFLTLVRQYPFYKKLE